MKLRNCLMVLSILFIVSACDQKPSDTANDVKNTFNDAIDNRPNEKLKDTVEDISDNTKEALSTAAEEIKDGAESAASSVKDAAK